MKNKKRIFALLLAGILMVGSASALPVHAGTMTTIIGEESYNEEIDNTIWNNPDGDVVGESGALIFPNDSTDSTRLISRASVVRSEQLKELFDAEFTMNFSNLPEGEEFIFAMGLSSIESFPGEEGNIELAFSNNGGLTAQVREYADGDSMKVLIENKSCGNVNGATKVSVALANSGALVVKVNESVIGESEVSISGEGSVGFLQTGNCGVTITDMQLSMYKYDRPENSNIFEDFESGDFNLSLMSSKMTYATEYYPSTMAIEDYNGSKVLMFCNVGSGYLVTKQQYSNFELTFDIPYIQATEEKDEDGNTITPECDSFGVSFGGATGGDDPSVGFTEASDLLLFMGNGVMGYMSDHAMTEATEHLLRESGDKIPTIKVSVLDGVVLAAIKWKDEPDSAYETMLTYTMSGTQTGYVAIWAPSGRSSTFAIDNVKLTNMDTDARLIEVERTSSKVEAPEDYAYEPQEVVYREVEEEKETGIPMSYVMLAGLAGVCILAIGITAGVTAVRSRKRKGGAVNEKEV